MSDEERYGKPPFWDSLEEYAMSNTEKILAELTKLNVKLYGENGFEGDIPEIKKMLKIVKGNETRSKVNQTTLSLLVLGYLAYIGVQVW